MVSTFKYFIKDFKEQMGVEMSKYKYSPALLDAVEYCELVDLFDEKKDIPPNDPIYKKNPKMDFYPIIRDSDICIVSNEPARLVIVFQGSKQLPDWINNFEGFRKIGGIHEGWYETFMKFKEEILKIVSAEGNNKRVQFFGHSRGGALAVISAYHVGLLLGIPCGCLTFGAPMVGDRVFRDKFRLLPINSTRCEINRDPVVNIPPKIAGYKKESYIKDLNNKPWYLLPLPGIGARVHVDYYSNVRRWS
jgi:predicted lipase